MEQNQDFVMQSNESDSRNININNIIVLIWAWWDETLKHITILQYYIILEINEAKEGGGEIAGLCFLWDNW